MTNGSHRVTSVVINRQSFLKHMGVGALTAGGAIWLSAHQQCARADTPTGHMLIGDLMQAINVRALSCQDGGSGCLLPRLLANGTYALPQTALNDVNGTDSTGLLSTWAGADVADTEYASADASQFVFLVDDKLVRHAGRPSSLTMPSPGLFRFEVQGNDFAGPYDSRNGNRRSEIVSNQKDGAGAGTMWASFCLILGETPGLSTSRNAIVHQWHSSDAEIGRSPVIFLDVAGNELKLYTCSSALLYGNTATGRRPPEDGVPVAQYSTVLPRPGERTYVTIQASFGEVGHLNVWINGSQVVDVDTPIGYFADLHDGSGRSILGYPHWGLYTTNQMTTDVVYIANPEWGTGDLSRRIASPLAVPDVN